MEASFFQDTLQLQRREKGKSLAAYSDSSLRKISLQNIIMHYYVVVKGAVRQFLGRGGKFRILNIKTLKHNKTH